MISIRLSAGGDETPAGIVQSACHALTFDFLGFCRLAAQVFAGCFVIGKTIPIFEFVRTLALELCDCLSRELHLDEGELDGGRPTIAAPVLTITHPIHKTVFPLRFVEDYDEPLT